MAYHNVVRSVFCSGWAVMEQVKSPTMAMQKLEQALMERMPNARRYARALIGETESADTLLALAVLNVVKQSSAVTFLTPTNMVLPWLYVELHKVLDTKNSVVQHHQHSLSDRRESTLYERFDSGLVTLTKLQKRIYLLTVLEQFKPAVTAHVLDQPVAVVKDHFQQAHLLVTAHIESNFARN